MKSQFKYGLAPLPKTVAVDYTPGTRVQFLNDQLKIFFEDHPEGVKTRGGRLSRNGCLGGMRYASICCAAPMRGTMVGIPPLCRLDERCFVPPILWSPARSSAVIWAGRSRRDSANRRCAISFWAARASLPPA